MRDDRPPLYLVRHGETVFNQQGRYQGHADSPLTERGIAQAVAVSEMLSERLKGADVRVVSSPLGRARATAQILVEHLQNCASFEIDDRLKEVGMGAWDGLTRAEIAERWPDARRGRATREWMFHGPGGERIESLSARVSSALADMSARKEQTFVLVTHAATGRIIRALHAGMPILDALKLDAPQDAALALKIGGEIQLLPTSDYLQRHSVAS